MRSYRRTSPALPGASGSRTALPDQVWHSSHPVSEPAVRGSSLSLQYEHMATQVSAAAYPRGPRRGDALVGRSIEPTAAGHDAPKRVGQLLGPRDQRMRTPDVLEDRSRPPCRRTRRTSRKARSGSRTVQSTSDETWQRTGQLDPAGPTVLFCTGRDGSVAIRHSPFAIRHSPLAIRRSSLPDTRPPRSTTTAEACTTG
jgi:hypothetical protein